MNGRNATLQKLADQAQALKDEPYDSPKVDLWESRARKFVSDEFGEEYLGILNRALSFGFVISSYEEGQQLHHKAMDDAATFLRELQDDDSPAQEVPPTRTRTSCFEWRSCIRVFAWVAASSMSPVISPRP
jgi:hypothetical protein